MSRIFSTNKTVPYLGGAPFVRTAQLLGNAKARVVPLFFNWSDYGASSLQPQKSVLVNFQGRERPLLNSIVSLYIDNTNSISTIYVFFPDTGYAVQCAPNSSGWFLANTNNNYFWVIGDGFVTDQIPVTSILVTEVFVPPAINPELQASISLLKASEAITQGATLYSKNLGPAALGDQIAYVMIDVLSPVDTFASMFQAGLVQDYIYVTSISAVLTNGTAATPHVCAYAFTTGDFTVEKFRIQWLQFATGLNIPVLQLSGINMKLDGTRNWGIRTIANAASGGLQVVMGYTRSPLP